jgi:hypothetical protein
MKLNSQRTVPHLTAFQTDTTLSKHLKHMLLTFILTWSALEGRPSFWKNSPKLS